MIRHTIIAALFAAMSAPAFANCGNNNGQGQGNGCVDTGTGSGTVTPLEYAGTVTSSSIANSGDSTNQNFNSTGDNDIRIVSGTGDNRNRNVAAGGAGGAGGTGLGGAGGSAVSTGSSAYAGSSFTSTTVSVGGNTIEARERDPVSTAIAPNIAPTALCAIGISAGAQGVSVGFSMGTSYIDENCVLLEQVRTVAYILNDKAVASEMMCSLPAYHAARARTGNPCAPTPTAAVAAPVAAVAPPAAGAALPPLYR